MASIKCGQCKQTHESVAEVKDCYAWEAAQEEMHLAQQAELAAELRNEQWFEGRGRWGDRPDPDDDMWRYGLAEYHGV